MEDILMKNILLEKKRSLFIAILGAILVSSLVLAASIGLEFFNGNDGTIDRVDDRDNSNDYVIELNGFVQGQYANGHIVGTIIAGNDTGAIHEGLISSNLEKTEDGSWNATNYLIIDEEISIVNTLFSVQQIDNIYEIFSESLSETSEIDIVIEHPTPATFTLYYQVLFDDNTGIEFLWMKMSNQEYLIVDEFDWNTDDSGFITIENSDDVHYLDPPSAFDPFLQELVELYSVLG